MREVKEIRDSLGRFKPGTRPGPGRPKRPRYSVDFLKAMREAVTPEDWRRITEKAKAQALAGCATARTFLAEYLLGIPRQHAPSLKEVAVTETKRETPADQLTAQAAREVEYEIKMGASRFRHTTPEKQFEIEDQVESAIETWDDEEEENEEKPEEISIPTNGNGATIG